MTFILDLDNSVFEPVWGHLLPPDKEKEFAAFLFVTPIVASPSTKFQVLDYYLVKESDFNHQDSDYLEISDEVRINIIKTAHKLNASIVELHSHLGHWPAAFSRFDLNGLKETVTHIWWRLKGKPYIAIVVTNSGYDALLWWDNPKVPIALSGILLNEQLLVPTNITLWGI